VKTADVATSDSATSPSVFTFPLDDGPVEVKMRDPASGDMVGRWRHPGGKRLEIDFLGDPICTVDGQPPTEGGVIPGFVLWPRMTFEINNRLAELVSSDPEVLERHYSRPQHQELAYSRPDPWLVAFHHSRISQARRLLAGVRGRVLDVGSGYSLLRDAELDRCRLYACDRDLAAVSFLLGQRVLAAAASAEMPPFAEGAFDAVYAGEIVEHLADPDGALRRWVSLLRPGGRLVVTTPNRRHLMARATRREVVQNPEHLFEYSVAELRAAVLRAGARVVSVEGLSLPLPVYVPGRGWRDALRVAQHRLDISEDRLMGAMRWGRRVPALSENLAIVGTRPR
jgi:SAM-dependent methyltransferase